MSTFIRSAAREARWLSICAPLLLAGCLSADSPGEAPTDEGVGGGATGVGGGGGSTAQGGGGSSTAGSGGGVVRDGGGGSSAGGGGTAEGGSSAGKIAAGVRWVGRFDATDPQKPKFGWGGVGFVAQINGTSLSVQVSNDNVVFFQPVVDGQVGTRLKAGQGTTTLQVATGLSAGSHRVELYRETEASQGGVSQLLSISGATLETPPSYSGRLIETVSDSSANGYGMLGAETHPNFCASTTNACGYTPDTQSNYLAYTAVLARALGADWSIIASSGWGMYRDNQGGTSNVMPNVYTEAYYAAGTPPDWDFSVKADAVIVSLGGNDVATGTPDATQYKDAFKGLAGQIRGKYPNAWIFPITGPMLDQATTTLLAGSYQTAITELGDAKIFYIDVKQQDCTKGTGCQWHPNVAEHQRVADVLTPIIKQKLGW